MISNFCVIFKSVAIRMRVASSFTCCATSLLTFMMKVSQTMNSNPFVATFLPRPEALEALPAIAHLDDTARVQTVNAAQVPACREEEGTAHAAETLCLAVSTATCGLFAVLVFIWLCCIQFNNRLQQMTSLLRWLVATGYMLISPFQDGWLHALLLAVGRLTGWAVLANSSFNVRGKPIINTVAAAFEVRDHLVWRGSGDCSVFCRGATAANSAADCVRVLALTGTQE